MCHRGADDPDAVLLAETFQATGEVDRVAHAAELHLHVAAHVAGQHNSSVEAYAHCQCREVEHGELRIQLLQCLLHCHRRRASLGGVILNVDRGVPEDEETVAEDFCYHALEGLGDASHDGEVAGEQEDQVPLRQRFGDAGEVPDVREHDGDFTPRDVQARRLLIAADDAPHHRLWHEAGEGLDTTRESAKGVLQLAHLPHARSPSRLKPCTSGFVVRKVQLSQAPHEDVKAPQWAGDTHAEANADAHAECRRHKESRGTTGPDTVHQAIELALHLLDLLTDLLPRLLGPGAEGGGGRCHDHKPPGSRRIQRHRKRPNLHTVCSLQVA
mmetsp:Transcript_94348/g.202545  ORF Transcript_94348/g.202545 Transcript_94348/m.202545 type:complete len:328 (+) Transcript_94348:768-1751(+)